MAAPRKIFRIEETAGTRHAPQIAETQAALRHAEIMRELGALRTTLVAAPPRRAAAVLSKHSAIERLASELHFVQSIISGTQPEQCGQAISGAPAAETIRIAHELTPS